MAAILFDESRYPLLVVSFHGTASDAEFDDYLTRMGRLFERRTTMVSILDATHAGSTPPIQRRRQAEWIKVNAHSLKRYSAGSVFVINSPFVRGALTAILWLQPMPTPYAVVGTLHEAEKWARGQLERYRTSAIEAVL